jgi:hypothetical protein
MLSAVVLGTLWAIGLAHGMIMKNLDGLSWLGCGSRLIFYEHKEGHRIKKYSVMLANSPANKYSLVPK